MKNPGLHGIGQGRSEGMGWSTRICWQVRKGDASCVPGDWHQSSPCPVLDFILCSYQYYPIFSSTLTHTRHMCIYIYNYMCNCLYNIIFIYVYKHNHICIIIIIYIYIVITAWYSTWIPINYFISKKPTSRQIHPHWSRRSARFGWHDCFNLDKT